MTELQNNQYQPYTQNNSNPNNISKSKKRLNILKLISSTQFLLVVILVMFGAIVYLLFNPPFIKQTEADKVAAKVAEMTTVNESENPLVATISDVDALKKENQFQAEVYEDAQNGDYVVAYTDKMIIFRKAENKIIYEGETPQQKLNKFQKELLDAVLKKAEESSISIVENDTPQINVVQDVNKLRQSVPGFYDAAAKNDLIALFPQSQVVILYRQSEDRIINSGTFKTVIE